MKLIIQPDQGAAPVLAAITSAKRTLDIAIFRFDHKDLERALIQAISDGVAVRALIACTNRRGEQRLRALESRLLAAGAVVARTNNDLERYHGKYLIVDRAKLYVLGFNFTTADLHATRSFGLVTTKPKIVEDALHLFEADSTRRVFAAKSRSFVVSPLNARLRLSEFLAGAKHELTIYDPEVSDPEMVKILLNRAEAGVKIRVIGKWNLRDRRIALRPCHPLRLHVRAIVRDRESIFIGSQSLRRLELDRRREVGLLIQSLALASQISEIFEHDWECAKDVEMPAHKVAKKIAKAVVKDLAPVAPVLEEVSGLTPAELKVDGIKVEQAVKEAVKKAVCEVVQEAVIEQKNVPPHGDSQ